MLSVGCSAQNDGPPLSDVIGNITLDGQPLEQGRIIFDPTDGVGTSYGAIIASGKYNARLSAGPKSVSIFSYRPSKTILDFEGNPSVEQFLPDRFNSKSTLTAEISGERKQSVDFELQSK